MKAKKKKVELRVNKIFRDGIIVGVLFVIIFILLFFLIFVLYEEKYSQTFSADYSFNRPEDIIKN